MKSVNLKYGFAILSDDGMLKSSRVKLDDNLTLCLQFHDNGKLKFMYCSDENNNYQGEYMDCNDDGVVHCKGNFKNDEHCGKWYGGAFSNITQYFLSFYIKKK